MGHREQLLEGAKQCLLDRGYAKTTARDIVAASGTNLASIGYHFGSKDALLMAAIIEALGEWGDEIERVLTEANQADPLERVQAMWAGVLESFHAQPGIWLSSFEIARVAMNHEELKKQLADAYVMAREGLAIIFLGPEEAARTEPELLRSIGSLIMSTFPGLYSQWTMDPVNTPSPAMLANALASISTLLAGRAPSA